MDDLHYDDGVPFYGIFREIPMSGQYDKEYKAPLYTIREQDDDLPSAHKIYMSCQTEYEAAQELTGSWEYWKGMLRTSSKIRKVIEEWREEKMLRDQTRAKKMLWEAAENGSPSAQRLLYEAKKEEREMAAKQKVKNKAAERESEMLQSRIDRLTELKAVK